MSDTCVPSLIVIGTAINLFSGITKNNLLPEAICCCCCSYNIPGAPTHEARSVRLGTIACSGI